MGSSELPVPAQFICHPASSPLSLFHLEFHIELTSNVKQRKMSRTSLAVTVERAFLEVKEAKCHDEYRNMIRLLSSVHQSSVPLICIKQLLSKQ